MGGAGGVETGKVAGSGFERAMRTATVARAAAAPPIIANRVEPMDAAATTPRAHKRDSAAASRAALGGGIKAAYGNAELSCRRQRRRVESDGRSDVRRGRRGHPAALEDSSSRGTGGDDERNERRWQRRGLPASPERRWKRDSRPGAAA